MSEPLQVALVGCGMIAEFHLRGWAGIPGVEVVALADPDAAAREDRRARFAPGARTYPDLDALLASERIELVDVLSPPALHAAHARAGRDAGARVICQKPLADELDEAVALAADFPPDRPLLVHENHRFRPWFIGISELVAGGELGELREVHLWQHDAATPPQPTNRRAARGVLLQYGIHLVDLAIALLGAPESVRCRLAAENPELAGESRAELELAFAGGRTAAIEVSWPRRADPDAGALLLGTEGRVEYDGTFTRGEPARLRIDSSSGPRRERAIDPTAEYVEAFGAFERAAVAHVRDGAPAPQPAHENLVTLATTFAAYRAAETGRVVGVPAFAAEYGIDPGLSRR